MQRRENAAFADRLIGRYTLRGCLWTVPATVLLFVLLHFFGQPPLGPVATGMALAVSLVVAVCLPFQSAVLQAELERERLELEQRRNLVTMVVSRNEAARAPGD